VRYAKAFFDLQLHFAEKAAELSGPPLARAVLDYTNFYIRFGLGRDFDPAHPRWREYLGGLGDRNERHDWTYRFYLARPHGVAPPNIVATFGCFSYAWLSEDRIRLHFENAEKDGLSPLTMERRDRRAAELAALFAHVRGTRRTAVRVVGASWLYNLSAYRRLFPESYLATAHVVQRRFRHMPLWGQFVNRYGDVREDAARQFRDRLGRQSTLEHLDQCFPFQVLRLEAPAVEFYESFGV
jgi:hypothetical protein